MFKLIDGKAVAEALNAQTAAEIKTLRQRGVETGLAVILAGDDPASRIYVNNKKKACAEAGIRSYEYLLGGAASEEEILELIAKLNADKKINGILCQLPLPAGVDKSRVLAAIDPQKDVDGFHPLNMGKLLCGAPGVKPCTPAGIIKLLDHYGISPAGKNCVVIGRSDIVGKPVAAMLLQKNATVTVCHSKTADLPAFTRAADIIICAAGKAGLVTAEMVKPGAVIIDVGINRTEGRLCGDVDFESVKEKAAYITPVPGGVGPMTVAMLLRNTLAAAKNQNGLGDVL